MSKCARCGRPHVTRHGGPSCKGHLSKNHPTNPGGPCTKPPMRGQAICDRHGGLAQQNKAAAAARIEQAKAEKLMLTLGEPINDGRDYAEVIADRVAIRRGHVAWLLVRVQALEPEALVWGLTKRKTVVEDGRWLNNDDEAKDARRAFAGTDEGDTHEAKPSIWYVMYEAASEKLEKLCLEAVRVGIEARRLQMDERMADQWVRVIDGIVSALGHDPNAPETAEIVARHLELVA